MGALVEGRAWGGEAVVQGVGRGQRALQGATGGAGRPCGTGFSLLGSHLELEASALGVPWESCVWATLGLEDAQAGAGE